MNPRTRMLVAGVIAPLVIAAAATVVMLLALPGLPDPIAVHWGPSGQPDNFGSPVLALVLVGVVVIAYSALSIVVIRGSGRATVNQRVVLATAPFLATVLGVITAGSLIIQQGLSDGHDAPSILPVVGIAFGSGALLGVAAWFLLPATAPMPALGPAETPTLELREAERVTWMRHLEPARWLGTVLVIAGVLVVVGGGAAVWVSASTITLVTYLIIMGVAVALVTGSLFWTVRVDSRGFVARSLFGFPRFAIPLEDIEGAASIAVSAASGFGGWGVRWGGPRKVGIILNSGEALEVRRKSGGALLVTTAESERAAALLNSLAQRA